MSYRKFDIARAVRDFGLTLVRDPALLADAAPVTPLAETLAWVSRFRTIEPATSSEAARSQYLTLPILLDASRQAGVPAHVLPGVRLDVDRERSLPGTCDYVVARTPTLDYFRGPLIAVAEAKREDVLAGRGQCAAEMVAIQRFNAAAGTPLPAVYGCVSSGTAWLFLRLADRVLSYNPRQYLIDDGLPAVIGALVHLMRGPDAHRS